MPKRFNMKTREDLLLIQLGEECAEVTKNISKALRFGKDEVYAKVGLSNEQRITQEMQDLIAVFDMLVADGILPDLDVPAMDQKRNKVEEYLGYSKELGIIK